MCVPGDVHVFVLRISRKILNVRAFSYLDLQACIEVLLSSGGSIQQPQRDTSLSKVPILPSEGGLDSLPAAVLDVW